MEPQAPSRYEEELTDTVSRANFEVQELVKQIIALIEDVQEARDCLDSIGIDGCDALDCCWDYDLHPEDLLESMEATFESRKEASERRREQAEYREAERLAALEGAGGEVAA